MKADSNSDLSTLQQRCAMSHISITRTWSRHPGRRISIMISPACARPGSLSRLTSSRYAGSPLCFEVCQHLLLLCLPEILIFIAESFNGILDRNRYVKQFTCYNQLCVLMFGQLSNRESLRDVVLATQAHASKAYHLGFGKHDAKRLLRMPTPSAIIASSRSSSTRSSQKPNDVESLTSSS